MTEHLMATLKPQMPNPTVSIVIPAYNAERSLDRAVRSALGQSWERVEVVVVDDGSTDATPDVCAAYGSRIRYVHQANAGAGAARNLGIEVSTGQVIAFLDADDELLPRMVSRLMGGFGAHPTAAAVSGAFVRERPGMERTRFPTKGAVLGNGNDHGLVRDFFEAYRMQILAWTGALLVRREVFDLTGGFREGLTFGQDKEMWCRIAGRFPWAFVDEVVSIYHQHPSTSRTLARGPTTAVGFLYPEVEMRALVREHLWDSYRRFRRDLVLRRCRAAMLSGKIEELPRLLRLVPPAPLTLEGRLTKVISNLPPFLGRSIVWGALHLKRLAGASSRRKGGDSVARSAV